MAYQQFTEDAEMESFLSAIPGSFNTDWGEEVWKRVGEQHEGEDQGRDQPVAGPHGDTTAHRPSSFWNTRVIGPIIGLVRKPIPRHSPTQVTTRDVYPHSTTVNGLSTRVARSVGICKNRGPATRDNSWRIRSRTCIEATSFLVFCANAKLAWFGGILELHGDIGKVEKIRELSLAGTDQLFVMRWTCLSLLAIRPNLSGNKGMWGRSWARVMIDELAMLDEAGNGDALAVVQKIDKTFVRARRCLNGLYWALDETEGLTEQVKEKVRGLESKISDLEQINIEADRLLSADHRMSEIQSRFYDDTYGIISQIPGPLDDFGVDLAPIPFSRLVELFFDHRRLQFIRPNQILKSMCSPALILRNILEGHGDADAFKELRRNLSNYHFTATSSWQGDEMK